jgi:hypothetical protein
MKLKYLSLILIIALQAGPAKAVECAPQADRFILQAPSAQPVDRFIPQVTVVPRDTFRPYVPTAEIAQRAPQPIYAQEATRFIPDPRFIPQPQYVSPADREQVAQRFIPNVNRPQPAEVIPPCNCFN